MMQEPNETLEQDTNLPAAPADTAPAETEDAALAAEPEPEDDDAPADDRIFGLPRRTFHLVVVGYALGVILVGLLGLAGLVDENTGTMLPGVVCAGIGYLFARYLDKRDAANENKPRE